MSNPVIGYENLLETATLTASSEATGFDAENIADWLTHDFWQPTGFVSENLDADLGAANNVDYFALSAHDLGTQGARVRLQHDDNSGFTTPTTVVDVTPTDDLVIFRSFASVSERYWRILVTGGTAASSLGVAAIGARLDMPDGMQVGFVPPNLSYNDKVLNHRAQGGAFIGRSIQRSGAKGTMRFDLMTPAWVRSDWQPFIEHARIKPFFLSWDETNYEAEAAYCWTEKGITPPRYSHTIYMQAQLDYQGLVT